MYKYTVEGCTVSFHHSSQGIIIAMSVFQKKIWALLKFKLPSTLQRNHGLVRYFIIIYNDLMRELINFLQHVNITQ